MLNVSSVGDSVVQQLGHWLDLRFARCWFNGGTEFARKRGGNCKERKM